jgi:hypothetical protein
MWEGSPLSANDSSGIWLDWRSVEFQTTAPSGDFLNKARNKAGVATGCFWAAVAGH